jgi:RimJ/RimL family protein N-acetyltransferase
VAEKTGARFEGILRKRLKLGDRNIDAAMYSLIPDDFSEKSP